MAVVLVVVTICCVLSSTLFLVTAQKQLAEDLWTIDAELNRDPRFTPRQDDDYGPIPSGSEEDTMRYRRNANYPLSAEVGNPYNFLKTGSDCASNCQMENRRFAELNTLRKFKELLGRAAENGMLSPLLPWTSKSIRDATDNFPGLNIWANVNLSGRREVPLYAEEPYYVIVRREDDYSPKPPRNYADDPFIPPRGRKHNPPNLNDIFNYYDPFIPHRGRRDSIKDIFKHDDLFIPHRGKREALREHSRSSEAQPNNINRSPCTTTTAAAADGNGSSSRQLCRRQSDSYSSSLSKAQKKADINSDLSSSPKKRSPKTDRGLFRRQAEDLREFGNAFYRK